MTDLELLSALEAEAGYRFKRVDEIYYSDNEAQYTYEESSSFVTGVRLPRRALCIPSLVFSLVHIKVLDLSLVKIKIIPKELSNLVHLEKINLYNTEIRFLPQCIGELRKLKNINLAQTPVEALPDSICDLENLEKLTLWGTRIRDLPENIGRLKKLRTLDLSECRLRSLPKSIVELNIDFEDSTSFHCIKITKLSIDDKCLLSKIKLGKEALAEYFRSEKYLNPNYDYESKVVLLGNGASGKTCLMHAILNNFFNPTQAKTEGISLSKWIVEEQENLGCVHIWDFGGQETYHPLYSLFLSEADLYIIVLNGRSDEKPDLWLQFIQLYAPAAPIIMVINRMDENPKADLDRNYYCKKYASLRILDIVKCSCKDYDKPEGNIQKLRDTILSALNSCGLKLYCDDRWLKFRNLISRCPKNYLSFTDLEQYWNNCGIKNEQDQDLIIRKCCDYGVFLKPGNSSTLIIDPEWFSAAISKLYTYFEKHKIDLLVKKTSLYRYLYDIDNAYDSATVDNLIGVLNERKLCALVDQHIIVPYALDLYLNERPDHFADYEKFIVKYRISSAVIFQFLLIHLLKYRSDDNHVWRNAIEISYNNSRAAIEQSGRDVIIYLKNEKTYENIGTCFDFIITSIFQVHKEFKSFEIPFEVLIPYNKSGQEVNIIMEQIINNGGQVVIAKDNAAVTATNILNGVSVNELHKLLNKLKETSGFLSAEDKEAAESSIQIIEDEAGSAQPRKNYLRMALKVLNGIKGTAEFAAAVGAIVQFFQPILL